MLGVMNTKEILTLLHGKPSERERWMYFGFLVISVFIYFNGYFYPKYQENKSLYSAIEASHQLMKQPVQAKKVSKHWSGSSLALEEAPVKILDPIYLQNIEVLGAHTSPVANEAPWLKRNVTLSVSGSYHALEDYLSYLQNMPAPLMIKTLSIKTQETDSEVLEMELTGVVYGSN